MKKPVIKIFYFIHRNNSDRQRSFRGFEIALFSGNKIEFLSAKNPAELEKKVLDERARFLDAEILNQIPILNYYKGNVTIKRQSNGRLFEMDLSKYGNGKGLTDILKGLGVGNIYELTDRGKEQTNTYRQIKPRQIPPLLKPLIS